MGCRSNPLAGRQSIAIRLSNTTFYSTNTMGRTLSRAQFALMMGISGTGGLLFVAFVFDYSSVENAILFGLLMGVVNYVFDVRLLATEE